MRYISIVALLLLASGACGGTGVDPAPSGVKPAYALLPIAIPAPPGELSVLQEAPQVAVSKEALSPTFPPPTLGRTPPTLEDPIPVTDTSFQTAKALQAQVPPAPTTSDAPATAPPVPLTWQVELKIDWPATLGIAGVENLLLGVTEACPGSIGCRGSAFDPGAFIPGGGGSFKVYVCHPPTDKFNCEGEELLSYSLMSTSTAVQGWLVEVSYPGELRLTFGWDPEALLAKLGGSINLRIVDSAGKTDMINPSPFRFPHRVSIATGDDTVAFFVCSEVVGVAAANPCPDRLP